MTEIETELKALQHAKYLLSYREK